MVLSKAQFISAIRSDLMFENDWMDYAQASQMAYEKWEDYDYLIGDGVSGDLEDVQ